MNVEVDHSGVEISEDASPLSRLRHHVSGAIERGEATAIEAIEACYTPMQERAIRNAIEA